MRRLAFLFLLTTGASVVALPTAAHATPIVAFSTDFDGGIIVAPGVTAVPTLNGAVIEPVQGYSGVPGFSGNFLHSFSGGAPQGTPGNPYVLTLGNLPAHTKVDINFLLAIIDS